MRSTLLGAILVLVFAPYSIAEGGKPLDLMMPMAFLDLSEKEKRTRPQVVRGPSSSGT